MARGHPMTGHGLIAAHHFGRLAATQLIGDDPSALPTRCPGAGKRGRDARQREPSGWEAECLECGRVVLLRSDRKLRIHR